MRIGKNQPQCINPAVEERVGYQFEATPIFGPNVEDLRADLVESVHLKC